MHRFRPCAKLAEARSTNGPITGPFGGYLTSVTETTQRYRLKPQTVKRRCRNQGSSRALSSKLHERSGSTFG